MKNNKSNNNNNKPSGNTGGNKTNNGVISDNRFKHAQSDPKFQMYRKKDMSIKLDSRFEKLLTNKFNDNAPIDQYGRKIDNKKIDRSIKKNFTIEKEEEKEEKKKPEQKNNKKQPIKKIEKEESESEEEDEEEDIEIEQEGEEEGEKSKIIEYAGFEYNSDTESSDAEEFEGDEIEEEEKGELDYDDDDDVPRGDATKRFAVLNCDWDNINSKDLFVLLNSFVPPGGHIENVTVYPSDFGLEQMAKEKQSGPSKEIWSIKKEEELQQQRLESTLSYDKLEDVESLDGKGFNLEKLRQYELSKLKYYYAIVICDSVETANKIYDECEGIEIEDTANVLDLRFVPDDQKFTNPPRDSCDQLPATTKGFGFSTSVLKGTTVDFTWDVDKTRKKLLTKNYSKEEAREEDLKAYLADPTSSEEEEEDDSEDDQSDDGEKDKNAKRLKLRNKYKSLLLGDILEEKEKDDVQITFSSAFSDNKKLDSDDDGDEGFSVKFDGEDNIKEDESSDSEDDEEGEMVVGSGVDSEEEEEEDSEADDESSDSEDDNIIGGDSKGSFNSNSLNDDDETPDWAKDLKSDDEDDVREMTINTNLSGLGKKLLKEKEQRENSNVFNDYLQKKKEKKQQKKRDRREEISQLKKEQEEKEKQLKKNQKKGKLTEEEKKQQAELELLLIDENGEKKRGFSKKKLEKEAKLNTLDPHEKKKLEKKLKKKNDKLEIKENKNVDIEAEGFKIDVKDSRFNKIYNDDKFALDPTDPKFMRTSAMVEIINEKKVLRKSQKEQQEKEILERRKQTQNQNNNVNGSSSSTASSAGNKNNLSEMALNIKRKAEERNNLLNSKKLKSN